MVLVEDRIRGLNELIKETLSQIYILKNKLFDYRRELFYLTLKHDSSL